MTNNRRGRGWAVRTWAGMGAVITLAAGLLTAGRPGEASLASADKEPPPAAASGGLGYVPADAAAFVTARVSELWRRPEVKAFRQKMEKDDPKRIEEMFKGLGLTPDQIDRLTLVKASFQTPQFELALVSASAPVDRKKVLAAAAPAGKEEKTTDGPLFADPDGRAVLFLGDAIFVVGPTDAVREFLRRPTGQDAGRGFDCTELARTSQKHTAAAGVNVRAFAKQFGDDLPPDAEPFSPLLRAKSALLTVDAGEKVEASLHVTFKKELDAIDGEKGLAAVMDLFRGAIDQEVEGFSQSSDPPALLEMLTELERAAKAAAVERRGVGLQVNVSFKIEPKAVEKGGEQAADRVRAAAARATSWANLGRLARALRDYEASYGTLPTQAIYDEHGKPLLSWRVALLPYLSLEADNLYKQFHRDAAGRFDEAWDSDHNKKLLEKMPAVYAFPGDDRALKAHETYYQGFAGPHAVFDKFDNKIGLKLVQISDGTRNTLLLVESAKSVPWTKPEDVPFDEGKLLPRVGGHFKNGFQMALCDGRVRMLPLTIKEETLRALITCDGGEVIDFDLDK